MFTQKILILSLLLSFMLGFHLSGESQSLNYGIKAGLNISNHTDKFRYSGNELSPETALGYQVGLITRMKLGKELKIGTEPSLIMLGANYNESVTLDGYNLMPWLSGQQIKSPRNQYAYFLYGKLEAMVVGDWKLRIASKNTQLFNLKIDPQERFNRAKEYPRIVKQIHSQMQQMAKEVGVPLAQPRK